MSSFAFGGNNLVEIGALTALVGSSVAESLILGNRGPAGVAWGATSSFGTISVVRACFSGACSGWLRESLGVRAAASDEAVGLELAQDSNRAGNLRRRMSEPLAIFCHNCRVIHLVYLHYNPAHFIPLLRMSKREPGPTSTR